MNEFTRQTSHSFPDGKCYPALNNARVQRAKSRQRWQKYARREAKRGTQDDWNHAQDSKSFAAKHSPCFLLPASGHKDVLYTRPARPFTSETRAEILTLRLRLPESGERRGGGPDDGRTEGEERGATDRDSGGAPGGTAFAKNIHVITRPTSKATK